MGAATVVTTAGYDLPKNVVGIFLVLILFILFPKIILTIFYFKFNKESSITEHP